MRGHGRIAVLISMGIMMLAVACGSRTTLFDDDDDSADAADDASALFDTGADAPLRRDAQVVDARVSDARVSDATTFDAADARIEDAAIDSGEIADASDAGNESDACANTLHADAIHGSDSNDGTAANPFQTITKAIAVANTDACVTTIQVSAGTYDVANGETFPLRVPPNMLLVGDEANKGVASGNEVFIDGSGFVYAPVGATIYPGAGATIAGLEITAPSAPVDAGWLYPIEVLLVDSATSVTVRNNTIAGSGTAISYGSIGTYADGTTGHVITHNVVTGNAVGIFNGGGASQKVEANVVTHNLYGVEEDFAGADLGGGAFGSAGLNVLSCNLAQNLWVEPSAAPASNNYWDNVPPTTTTTTGSGHADIELLTSSPPITTGAMLASPNCP